MPGDRLADDVPIAVADRDAERPRRLITLEASQRAVLLTVVAAVVTAIAAPAPVTKRLRGFVLALFWARLLFELDERFIGMFVLLLPTLQLAPLETLGIPAL